MSFLKLAIASLHLLTTNTTLSWADTAKPRAEMPRYSEVEDKILAKANQLNQDGYGQKTVVGFHVRRDGKLQDVWVIEKSGSPTHDALAVNTVKSCAPFNPLPKGSAPVQKFALDINRNAHTWTYSNDRGFTDLT